MTALNNSNEPIVLSGHYWMRSRFELPESGYVALVEKLGLGRLWFEQLSLSPKTDHGMDEIDGELVIARRTDAGEVGLFRHGDGTVSLIDLRRGSATIE